MFTLHGNGVDAGIAIGRARLLRSLGEDILKYNISVDEVEQEISRLQAGLGSAQDALHQTANQLGEEDSAEVRGILGAHITMLEDPVLVQEPMEIIRRQHINAEAALQMHAENLEGVFNRIDDPYLSGKSADVVQVISRIQGELLKQKESTGRSEEEIFDGEIIVANDLMPADTVRLSSHQISAFITNLGGPISHTAILARSMKIPAIVGLHGGIHYLRTGDLLIIDGKRGVVLVNPDTPILKTYQRRRERILRTHQRLDVLIDERASTLDGHEISLCANIEFPEEMAEAMSLNTMGVGLYRTEFLFMNRCRLPSEEEQVRVYASVLRQTDRPVTIRTLDLGSDKQVDGGRLHGSQIANPALGRRAIRLCLHDLSLFKPQLRAIYRAAVYGQARIMIPMLSNIDEVDQLFMLLEELRQELHDQKIRYDPHVPIGGMVEVPAAAVAADLFADRLDFLSIGTNDLIQYTLAIDRIDDEVDYLYDPVHPAVLRLIKATLDAGSVANIPVSMCGEMAGDPRYTRILLGMGLRDFSMDVAAILEVKRRIRLTDISKAQPLVEELLKTGNQKRIRELVEEINR